MLSTFSDIKLIWIFVSLYLVNFRLVALYVLKIFPSNFITKVIYIKHQALIVIWNQKDNTLIPSDSYSFTYRFHILMYEKGGRNFKNWWSFKKLNTCSFMYLSKVGKGLPRWQITIGFEVRDCRFLYEKTIYHQLNLVLKSSCFAFDIHFVNNEICEEGNSVCISLIYSIMFMSTTIWNCVYITLYVMYVIIVEGLLFG